MILSLLLGGGLSDVDLWGKTIRGGWLVMAGLFGGGAPSGVSPETWRQALSSKGSLIVTVHGTGDGAPTDHGSLWWQVGSEFQANLAKARAGDKDPVWLPFHWSGKNSDAERFAAAANLASLCGALSRRGKDYSILGHSHAGNVLEYAWSFFAHRAGSPERCSKVVTFGAPFFHSKRKFMNAIAYIGNIVAFPLLLSVLIIILLNSVQTIEPYLSEPLMEPYSGKAIDSYLMEPSRLLSLTPAFESQKKLLQYIRVPSFIVYVFLIISSYASWKFGFRYFLSNTIFRPKWSSRTSEVWLGINSSRDEVIGLLPKLSKRRSAYVTPEAVSSALQSGSILLGLLLAFSTFLLSITTSFFGQYRVYIEDANFEELLWRVTWAVSLAFAVFFLCRFLSFAIGLMPVKGRLSSFISDSVHNILRGSAYGDDFNFSLKTVSAEPQRMRVRPLKLDKVNLGGLTPAIVEKAVDALYDGVIGFESAEELAVDPQGLWSKLNDALYHNAYFEDEDVIRATAGHLGRE